MVVRIARKFLARSFSFKFVSFEKVGIVNNLIKF